MNANDSHPANGSHPANSPHPPSSPVTDYQRRFRRLGAERRALLADPAFRLRVDAERAARRRRRQQLDDEAQAVRAMLRAQFVVIEGGRR